MNFDPSLQQAANELAFSSPAFLFAFMPVFFAAYYMTPNSWRNVTLLVASLLFYYANAGSIAVVLALSIVLNQVVARVIDHAKTSRIATLVLWVGIVLNLIPLLYYKYWTFGLHAATDTASLVGISVHFTIREVVLPAGISFFTFQGLSYLVDIYRREIRPAQNLIDFGMYHTLFPQLIAGPIVRFVEIQDTVRTRPIFLAMVQAGALRFMLGLGKKIILADNAGTIADQIFALPTDQLTTGLAWLATICYTLQIFFDFSGYSDMAIGMGQLLGFRFPENFDQPYRSRNITEFWRRWHMTLSRWFRDYVYIPLGGNRHGPGRTLVNLLVVFFLCGLWHGANYTFIVWGLYHGLLLVIERVLRIRMGFVPSGWIGHACTVLLVMIGWVFFRAPTLTGAAYHLQVMFGAGANGDVTYPVSFYLTPDRVTFLIVAIVVSLFPAERVQVDSGLGRSLLQAGTFAIFLFSLTRIAANGFNPFIYYRF